MQVYETGNLKTLSSGV